MLVSFYKMIFDISFYFSLAAFAVAFFFGQETNPFTFVLLLVAALLAAFAEKIPLNRQLVRRVAVVLPAIAFLWEHTAPGRWELVFPWMYLGIVIWKEKLGQDYDRFRGLLKGVVWTWLLYLVCTSFRPEDGLFGLEQCVPYVILSLVSAVLLMQALRYQEGSGSTKSFEKFQIKQTVFFLAGCLLLTVGRAAQLIVFLVESVLLPLGKKLLYGIMSLIMSLFRVMPDIEFRPEQEYLDFFQGQISLPDTEGIAQDVLEGMATAQPEEKFVMDWTPYLIAAAVLVVVAVLIVLFFNSTQKQRTVEEVDEREDLDEVVETKKKLKKHSLHPDLVIRYYYREFMKKAEWAENRVYESDTTEDIAAKFLARKPMKKEEAEEITSIYRKVRYNNETATREDVARMKKNIKSL